MKNLLLFLFFTFQLSNSQIVSYHYDTRINFIFEEDSTKGTSLEFNSKDLKTPVISKTYLTETESSKNSVSFHTMLNGQMYKMNGELIGDKYLNADGYTVFVKETGVYKFKKIADSLFDYKGFQNLEKSTAEMEDGASVEIFTKKMNNGINYSPATINFMGEIYGLAPPLILGEFVVYSAMKTRNGYFFPIFTSLENIKNEVSFDFEQINAVIEDKYEAYYNKKKHDNSPVFCEVTSPVNDASERTGELIDEFFGTMCELDSVWNNSLKPGEFNKIYVNELERRYQLYKNHQVLPAKQLQIFKRELLIYLPKK